MKIGDRVVSTQRGGEGPGVIVENFGQQFPGEFSVVLDRGGSGARRYIKTYDLTPETPRFVNVVTQKTVWVTLPGDNAGHKLTNDDALTLLRQLEEALS